MRYSAPQWRPSLARRRTPVRSVIEASAFASILVALLFLFMPLEVDHPGFLPADLPTAEHASSEDGALQNDALTVTITRDGSVYFHSIHVSREDLPDMIREEVRGGAKNTVYLNVDSRAKYGDIKAVLDCIHETGISNITFLTAWSRD